MKKWAELSQESNLLALNGISQGSRIKAWPHLSPTLAKGPLNCKALEDFWSNLFMLTSSIIITIRSKNAPREEGYFFHFKHFCVYFFSHSLRNLLQSKCQQTIAFQLVRAIWREKLNHIFKWIEEILPCLLHLFESNLSTTEPSLTNSKVGGFFKVLISFSPLGNSVCSTSEVHKIFRSIYHLFFLTN